MYSKFLLYADDTKVYRTIKTEYDCMLLQQDLDRLTNYYIRNRISVNVLKCNHISFTRRVNPINYTYKLNGTDIVTVDKVRDLGVLLDAKLSFSCHIDSIVDKAYRNLGFIIRVTQPFKDMQCIKILYYAYVRSVLEYCSTVWNPHYKTYRDAIEKIQRRFLKHLNYRSRIQGTDYAKSCKRHNVPQLEGRRLVRDMMMLHDACSGSLDCCELTSVLLRLKASSQRTRQNTLFAVPLHRTKYGRNCLASRLPRTYNTFFESADPFHLSRSSFRKCIAENLPIV